MRLLDRCSTWRLYRAVRNGSGWMPSSILLPSCLLGALTFLHYPHTSTCYAFSITAMYYSLPTPTAYELRILPGVAVARRAAVFAAGFLTAVHPALLITL